MSPYCLGVHQGLEAPEQPRVYVAAVEQDAALALGYIVFNRLMCPTALQLMVLCHSYDALVASELRRSTAASTPTLPRSNFTILSPAAISRLPFHTGTTGMHWFYI